jgi:putative oxidoreductase
MTVAAVLSLSLTVLHLAIIPFGGPAYEFFTAPDRMTELARQGSLLPALATLLVATVFAVFGLYALSAAGRGPRLPQPRIILIGICGIYLLRGLVVVPQLLMFLNTTEVPLRALVFSVIALGIGIVYTIGTALRWSAMPTA